MSRDGKEQNPSSANNYNGCMDQDNDEDVDLNNHNNDRLDIEIQTPPNTKRIRLMDNSELSDDNTLSTTTFGSCNGEQPSISPQLKYHNHQNNNTGSIGSNRNHVHNQQMIDLGVEFPALPNVLNPKDIQQELQLDPKFDLGQFSKQHNQNDNNNAISNISNKVNVNMNDKMNDNLSSFPMIFDWDKLKEATDPQQLRTEALRKQERGKYVRRDSLSSEQAADRRYY